MARFWEPSIVVPAVKTFFRQFIVNINGCFKCIANAGYCPRGPASVYT